MAYVNIRDELADELLGVAEREHRSVDEVLAILLDHYRTGSAAQAAISREIASEPKTGAEIAAMLAQMEPIEFADTEITDPVEWVNAQRRKDTERLNPYWEGRE